MLTNTYRIISWLSAALSFANAFLVASDLGRQGSSVWTNGVTFVVAALIAWAGMVALGIERSLSKLRRASVTDAETSEWQRCWKWLILFLIAGMLFLLLVMLAVFSAILSRFQQGYPLFG